MEYLCDSLSLQPEYPAIHRLVALVGRSGSGAVSARNDFVSRLERYPNILSVMCFTCVDNVHVLLLTFRAVPSLVEYIYLLMSSWIIYLTYSYRLSIELVVAGMVGLYLFCRS